MPVVADQTFGIGGKYELVDEEAGVETRDRSNQK
jgi:hypothetical protein